MNDVKEVYVDHVEAFEDAISQGVFVDSGKVFHWHVSNWMYMGSNGTHHFFKHSFTRENIKAERVEA